MEGWGGEGGLWVCGLRLGKNGDRGERRGCIIMYLNLFGRVWCQTWGSGALLHFSGSRRQNDS